MERIGGRFVRSEARSRAKAYLMGLLSPVERKNSWQLAEVLGEATPYGCQQFLYRSSWGADALRDDLRSYVVAGLGDEEAILVLDETGFLKKGTQSVGVQRQYSGTAGRIENCQIGVFLAYSSRHGSAFIDRSLYLPQSWTEDRERCRRASVPETVGFATKPALGRAMLERALSQKVPCAWVTADSIYGDDRRLRLWLEEQEKGYVLAVSSKEYVPMGWYQVRISEIWDLLSEEDWQTLSAGAGAKGPRLYEWQRLPLNDPFAPGWKRWLLVRRSLEEPTELTAYACFAPAKTPLTTLVQVAGSRWTIEACFEQAKSEVGLDHYEVRSWQGWYRHITLACLAHAMLAVLKAKVASPLEEPEKRGYLVSLPSHSLNAFRRQRGLSYL